MDQKVVFFDLDGTLLNENKVVLESSKRAVRTLQEKGVYTVISTGRSPKMFDWLLEELNISSYVSMNGQYVVFEGEEIYANPLDPDMIHDLSTVVHRNGDGLAYSNHQEIRVNADRHPFMYPSYEYLQINYPIVETDFYKRSSVHQIQIYCERKDAQFYKKRYLDHSFLEWGDYGSDMLPKGASKAVGVQKIMDQLGIHRKNSYAFGDGTNDFEMLDFVGTGIAMENAVPELKAQADFVTTSCSDDGIVNGLIHFGLLEPSIFEDVYS